MYSLSSDRVHWQLWGVAFVLASLMTALAAHGIFVPGDVTFARTIQEAHALDALKPVSTALYEFGMIPVWPIVTLGVALFVSLRGQVLGGAFIVLAASARVIGGVIKELVERPRPTDDYVAYVEGANGFSYPSGHVFGTVLLVGFIAYVLIERETSAARRWLIGAGAGAIMFLMGLQRVFAGAHWPTDALAGWLWGGLTLFVLIQVYRAMRRSQLSTTC
jgi:membrane-associated phospholipid phosphatase